MANQIYKSPPDVLDDFLREKAKKMEDRKGGGPAFPQAKVTVLAEDGTPNEAASVTHGGMTLRDYFAAKALGALITTQASWRDLDLHPVNGKSDKQLYAMFAYQFADAMIEARNQ